MCSFVKYTEQVYQFRTNEPIAEAEQLRPEYFEFFSEITGDIALLSELYVPVRVGRVEGKEIESSFRHISPTELDRRVDRSSLVQFHSSFEHLKRATFFRAFFLLSPIGRGKSTFLHYQFHVELPRHFPTLDLRPIVIDLLKCGSSYETFVTRFKKEIKRTILASFSSLRAETDEAIKRRLPFLCRIFQSDLRDEDIPAEFDPADPQRCDAQLKALKAFEDNDFSNYFSRLLEAATTNSPQTRRVQLLLAIDNLDQYVNHLPDAPTQNIFFFAHGVAKTLKIPLVIAMRDTSFRTNMAFGALPTLDTAEFFHLHPPPPAFVIQKRLEAVQRAAESEDGRPHRRETRDYLSTLVREFSKAVEADSLIDMSKGRDFSVVVEWIRRTSNHSVRSILGTVREALGSRHISSEDFERAPAKFDEWVFVNQAKIVEKMKRGLLLGHDRYFREDKNSHFLNICDCGRPNHPLNNILRLKLLQLLKQYSREGVVAQELIERLEQISGSDSDIVRTSLVQCIEKGLLTLFNEATSQPLVEVTMTPLILEPLLSNRVHITQNGMFHIEFLTRDSRYLDEIKFDTYLPLDTYNRVFRHYVGGSEPGLTHRLDSTFHFLQHIRNVEASDAARSYKTVLGLPDLADAMVALYADYRKKLDFFYESSRHRRK